MKKVSGWVDSMNCFCDGFKDEVPKPKYIKIYKKDIRGKFNLTVDPNKFYNPNLEEKEKI